MFVGGEKNLCLKVAKNVTTNALFCAQHAASVGSSVGSSARPAHVAKVSTMSKENLFLLDSGEELTNMAAQ